MPRPAIARPPINDTAGNADQAAITRLGAGGIDALDDLYHRHAGSLLQIARRLLGTRADAEDVVHDAFVAVPAAAGSLGAGADVGAWLRTMVINRCIDRNRSAARREALTLRFLRPAAVAPDSRDVIAAERIEAAIAALPAALRTVFVLRAIEGRSHPDIALALGIRTGTSEVRYFRAIRALRQALGDLNEA